MRFDTIPTPKPDHMTAPPPSDFEKANTERPPSDDENMPTERPTMDTDLEELRTGAATEDAEVIAKYEAMLANVRSADANYGNFAKKMEGTSAALTAHVEDPDSPISRSHIRFNEKN